MGKLKYLFIFLFLLASEAAFSRIKADKPLKMNSLQTIQKKIKEGKKRSSNLKQDLEGLESDLGKRNQKYIDLIKRKRKVSQKISNFYKELKENESNIVEKQIEIQSYLRNLIVNSIDKNDDAAHLLSKKILVETLNKKAKSLKLALKKNAKLKEEVELLRNRFIEYESVEKEILTFMDELERKRESLSHEYLSNLKKKKSLETKYKKLREKFLANQKNRRRDSGASSAAAFNHPLTTFMDLSHGKKGVTYKYSGRHEVTSSRQGKVVYSGNLSSFGNVVMIDHGKETRSVILGQFTPTVKKGMWVKTGQTIGHTTQTRKKGKLYFEVRKKNQVQNTMLLLDNKSITKNNYVNSQKS